MCGLDKAMVILAAVGIQSPFDAPRRLWQRRYLPSFSPQWESRALSMRQDGYANEDTSRHSHRGGNPEPFRCAKKAMPTKTPPVILTAVGIQSPFDAPTRLYQRRHLPSFSPQWESRALSMRQHGHGNGDTTGWRTGVPPWTIGQGNPILILDRILHTSLIAKSGVDEHRERGIAAFAIAKPD